LYYIKKGVLPQAGFLKMDTVTKASLERIEPGWNSYIFMAAEQAGN